MTLYEFLKPLQNCRKKYEEACILFKDCPINKFKGKIKDIPYELLEHTVTYWSYSFSNRLNIILEEVVILV